MKFQSEERSARPMKALPALVLAASMIVVALTAFAAFSSSNVYAQEIKDADVIVQFDGSDTAIRPIQFSGSISGVTALELSGFDVVMEGSPDGVTVCSIEGVGCDYPAESCFCQCTGEGPCRYWGYSAWDGQAWQSYQSGPSPSVIDQSGAVEGWRWGEAGPNYEPPNLTIPADQVQAAQDGLDWLQDMQGMDGGFGSIGASVEAAFAVGANKEMADTWRAAVSSPSLADYLDTNGAGFADENSAASGKLAVAVTATGVTWPAGALMPSDYYSATLGAYNRHIGFHAWGLLGALALGDEIPPQAVQFLKDGIMENGGWEWMEGFGSDTNSTSIAIQALVAAGEPVSATEVISGLAFLRSAQNSDGGFTYDPASPYGTDSDANSTAYAVQALGAACEDPVGFGWMKNGRTPVDYLRAAQLPDGSIEWMPDTGANLLATQQFVPALLGSAYPMIGDGPACPDRQIPLKAFLPQVSSGSSQ